MRSYLVLSVPALLTFYVTAASAHPQHGVPHVHLPGGGLVDGLLHPFFGLDHLLAMAAVGVLAARYTAREIWLPPAMFVVALIVGGALGLAGRELLIAESGIALSLTMLGAAIAAGRRPPLLAVSGAAAVFGLVHGFAHGRELPAAASPVMYAVGFTAGTIVLHLVGIGLGKFLQGNTVRVRSLQISGAAVALFGVALWLGRG